MPFQTGYNAILGRLTYVRFMVLPSYAYLQLKMPGPGGTITIHGSPEMALEAEDVNVELAEAEVASAELEHIKKSVDPCIYNNITNQAMVGFQPAKETRKFQVHPEDPAKRIIIGGDLPEE